MPVRITQPASFPGGRALVEVTGDPARFAEALEIAIVDQTAGVDKARHLDPRTPEAAWKPPVFWFPPEAVRREEERLLFELDHGVTFHLRPNMPYLLRLGGVDGLPIEERMVWRPMRGRSSAPEWTPPVLHRATALPPEPEPAVDEAPTVILAPQPEPELVAGPPPVLEPEPRRGGRGWLWAVLALIVLAGAGGAVWYAWPEIMARLAPPDAGQPAQQAAAPAPPAAVGARPTTVEEARRLVQTDVPVADTLTEAKRFAAAGSLDGAFLLFRRAAEAGSAEAAVALGAMYDPATHSAGTSPLPAPNPEQAAEWFRRAAEAGDAEAQFRLGRLLLSGKTAAPDGPEKGVMWLQKAAAQGHAGARDALPK